MTNTSKLFVKGLVFVGIHGSTGRETTDPQHFQVDIEMQFDSSKAAKSDKLLDTYDYKNAREIAEEVIEKEHHVLIETIATKIAERVCLDPKIFFVEVTVTKLHASKNGLPGITVSHKRTPQEMV